MKNFKFFSFLLNLLTGLVFAFISIFTSILTLILFIDKHYQDELLLKFITLILLIFIKFYAVYKIRKNNNIESFYTKLLLINLIDTFVALLIIYFELLYIALAIICAWFMYALIMTIFFSDDLKEMMKSEGIFHKFFKDESNNDNEEQDDKDDQENYDHNNEKN